MREVTITKNEANQRLDKFCLRYLQKPPKSFVHKMLRKKNITVNGVKADGAQMLAIGDIVRIYLSDETLAKFAVEQTTFPKGNVDVVYEDDDIIVLNKPVNLLTQPNEAGGDSLITRLFDGSVRPIAINRLDRNTSGLVLCAKNLPTAQRLSEMIRNRLVDKIYLAVAMGKIENEMTLDGHIIKDKDKNVSQIVTNVPRGTLAKEVATKIAPIDFNADKNVTLLKIYLHTGRSHQIRAHLQSIGHPLVGDAKYGGSGAKHQLLHAYKMVLDNGQEFIAPPPKDMQVYFGIKMGMM